MKEDVITELSPEDQAWLRRAESHILGILRAKYGDASFDRSEKDLVSVQRLIDDGSIRTKDILEAQCVGVVLGHVFVERTSMRWKRVANSFGDMISLHDDSIHFTLYPFTMVSKRLEGGREIDLVALFEDLATSLRLKK